MIANLVLRMSGFLILTMAAGMSWGQYFPVPPLSNLQLMNYTAINNLQMSINSTAMVNSATQYDASSGAKARPSAPRRGALATSTVLQRYGATTGPQKVAAAYPEKLRPEAERIFREMLVGYRKIETQFGIQENDVAGAVAAFIAGSYMSYRAVDFPDENFKPLVMQMRQIIGNDPAFARASEGEKRELYEQMAILGMFMATTQMALAEKPNPQAAANMRQAAKGYLEQFLKTDADRVDITAEGLVIR